MARDITMSIELPAPPDRVWQALTDPAALGEWLMPVEEFAPVPGQRFRLRATPMPGWDGVVHCEVLDVDAPRRLSYRWQGSRMRTATVVTWTLTPLDDGGTRLHLHHDGFTGLGGQVLALMHRGGWRKFLTVRLPGHLAGQVSRTEAEGQQPDPQSRHLAHRQPPPKSWKNR
jgi:uncharacterized protein YndB with AHSA1/START domain